MSTHKIRNSDFSNMKFPEFTRGGIAKCIEADPEIFYPREIENHKSNVISQVYESEALAKETCRDCPLIAACLEFSLLNNEIGIWGGTTENDRKALRRRMRRKSLF